MGPASDPHLCSLVSALHASHRILAQVLYLIRHGESLWNQAQAAMDLGVMYSQARSDLCPHSI